MNGDFTVHAIFLSKNKGYLLSTGDYRDTAATALVAVLPDLRGFLQSHGFVGLAAMYRISHLNPITQKLTFLEHAASWQQTSEILKAWSGDGFHMVVEAVPLTVEDCPLEPSLESDSWIPLGKATNAVLASLNTRFA